MLDDEKFYKYDAWNRVVEVHDKGDYHVDAAGDLAGSDLGDLIATYEYDVLGRIIHKTVSGSGDLNTTGDGDYFYYDGHRLLEHHKHNGTSLALYRQYVYGLDYIDEVVAYYDSDQTAAAPHFILQDVNYNVVATTDHEGHLEQQYNYKPYGERLAAERIESDGTITDILGTPSLIATTKGHQGLDHMPEIDAINNRTRILKPKLGRYMQEDPNQTSLVLFDVMLTNAQNAVASASLSAGTQYSDGLSLYGYLGSNPFNGRDPSGLFGNVKVGRMMTEVLGATGISYAFALDAVVYAQLLEGPQSSGVDRALNAFPYVLPAAVIGGLVAGATGCSSSGNILGGGIAGGITSYGMGEGAITGFVTGSLAAASIEGLFKGATMLAGRFGGWLDSMTVGGGNAAGGVGARWLRRIFGERGIGRLFSRGSARSVVGASGAAGTTTRRHLQNLMDAGGPTIELYTRQTRMIDPNRALHVAVGNADLANAATNAGARSLFTARVPKALIDELEYIGYAERKTTIMGGAKGEEIRFDARAMEFVFEFFGR